jgi:hypothetical protein
VIEHAHASLAGDGVAVEREVHFLDAVPLGALAELRFGAWRAAAEQDDVLFSHSRRITSALRCADTGWSARR